MYQKNYKSKTLRGKLRVCRMLSASPKVRRHVPETVAYNKRNLRRMVSKHSSLYVKLDVGSHGIGVFKITKAANGTYLLYSTQRRQQLCYAFHNLTDLSTHLKKVQPGKLIIQRAIPIDKVLGRPYDIRAMVQRKPGGSWKCTGLMGKIGMRNRIVTNHYQGAELCTMDQLFSRQGLSKAKASTRKKHLTKTALNISKALSKRKKGMHEMGVDLAYDTKQRLWVIEVNSNHPQFHPLRKLDPSAYQRMLRYARSYGRKTSR
ncbi:hypothetical protein EBB07_27715 [Paenibacillaceae bacterium]|nr:hypothetical protein EBB07_27715 [Paenibacillaceae bacterium]